VIPVLDRSVENVGALNILVMEIAPPCQGMVKPGVKKLINVSFWTQFSSWVPIGSDRG